jgi:hypothetical protein
METAVLWVVTPRSLVEVCWRFRLVRNVRLVWKVVTPCQITLRYILEGNNVYFLRWIECRCTGWNVNGVGTKDGYTMALGVFPFRSITRKLVKVCSDSSLTVPWGSVLPGTWLQNISEFRTSLFPETSAWGGGGVWKFVFLWENLIQKRGFDDNGIKR